MSRAAAGRAIRPPRIRPVAQSAGDVVRLAERGHARRAHRAAVGLPGLPPAGRAGAKRWRRPAAGPSGDEPLLGPSHPGLGRGAAASPDRGPRARRRTAATVPAGSSPATAAATSCSPRCTGAGWPCQPTSVAAGDGQRLIDARMVAAVRCAPPDNKPTPAERDTCAPWLAAELELVADGLRVIVCLGGFAWQAMWPVLGQAAASRCRGRGRRSAMAPKRGSAVRALPGGVLLDRLLSPEPAEHLHRPGHRRRCSMRCFPGPARRQAW